MTEVFGRLGTARWICVRQCLRGIDVGMVLINLRTELEIFSAITILRFVTDSGARSLEVRGPSAKSKRKLAAV